jgi:hypothetical protein
MHLGPRFTVPSPVELALEKKNAPSLADLERSMLGHELARDTGFEPVALSSGG